MATYWLSATTGDDGDDGSTYALAFATLGYAISQATSKGDIINVVNDGDHDLYHTATNRSAPAGTSWVDYGLLIRGTDTDGDPALATLVADVGEAINEVARIISGCEYWILRGLEFDLSPLQAAVVTGQIIRQDPDDSGPVWFDQCILDGGTEVELTNPRMLLNMDGSYSGTFASKGPKVTSCYIHNAPSAIEVYAGHNLTCNSNVFYNYTTAAHNAICVSIDTGDPAASVKTFHDNTLVFLAQQGGRSTGHLWVFDPTANMSTHTFRNNLIYVDAGTAGNKGTLSGLFGGATGDTNTIDGTSGYNYFNVGAVCTTAGSWTSGGIYEAPWSALATGTGTDDIITSDTLVTNVTVAGVFSSTTSSYSWVLDDYTLPIVDLRAFVGTTANYVGAQVGALPAFNEAPTAVADSYGPVVIGQVMNVTAGAGVLANDTDPDGDTLTASLSTAAHEGSVVLNSDGSFAYTADATFVGSTSFTYRAYDGSLYSNEATVTITTTNPDPVAPVVPVPAFSITNTIDVAPLFMPTREVTARAAMLMDVDLRRETDLRAYVDTRKWSEVTARSASIATNTTTELTMGGIASAEEILLTADGALDVAINSTTHYWGVSEMLALQTADVSHVYVRNNSTSTEVAVDILLVN